MDELKLCPFCGGDAKASQSTTHNRVYCKSCTAMTEAYDKPEQATAAWNQRAEKVGRWVVRREREGNPFECSRCGKITNNIGHNYCPNCGARMEEMMDNAAEDTCGWEGCKSESVVEVDVK